MTVQDLATQTSLVLRMKMPETVVLLLSSWWMETSTLIRLKTSVPPEPPLLEPVRANSRDSDPCLIMEKLKLHLPPTGAMR